VLLLSSSIIISSIGKRSTFPISRRNTVLTDLREELQISDNLHRELLKTVGNDDDATRQIRYSVNTL
jgi:hypothetical protein